MPVPFPLCQPLLCRPRRLPRAPISPVVSAASPATGSNPPPAVHCLGRALSVSARLPGEGPGVRAVFLPNSAFRIPDLPPACVPLALPVPFASAFRLSFILHPCVPVSVTGPVTLPRIRHRPCDDPRPRAPLTAHGVCGVPSFFRASRRCRVSRVACDAPQSSPFTTSSSLPRSPLTLTAILRFSPGFHAGGASPVSVTCPVTLPRIRHTPCDDPRPRDAPHRTRRVRRTLIFPCAAVLSTPVTEFLPLSCVACRAP